MLRWSLLAIPIFVGAFSAGAETAYVTDSLRLGIHAAGDTSDRAFDNLLSGAAVEVLERSPNYARVRLHDGREGWVKATYLVTTKPAATRVGELEAEIEGLRAEVSAAKAAAAAVEQEFAAVTNQAGSLEAIHAKIGRLEADNQAYSERLAAYRTTLPIGWVLLAVALVGAAGFASGLWWLDSLIRRRHGGFRVY
jgi:SH3 domain protein